jgi:hypothetical protein
MNDTLNNYYDMFDDKEGDVEFENYTMSHNASIFVLDMDQLKQSSEDRTVVKDKNGNYNWPLNMTDAEMKAWIQDIVEF